MKGLCSRVMYVVLDAVCDWDDCGRGGEHVDGPGVPGDVLIGFNRMDYERRKFQLGALGHFLCCRVCGGVSACSRPVVYFGASFAVSLPLFRPSSVPSAVHHARARARTSCAVPGCTQ